MPLRLPTDPELAAKVIAFRQTRSEQILEVGWISYIIGRGENKPAGIVALVLIACFLLIVLMLLVRDPDLPRKDIILSLFSLITLSLGYYFGKRGR